MYKIAICDDDNFLCADLEKSLISIARKNGWAVVIDVFYTGEGILKEFEQTLPYDMILLDIEFPNIDGITVARKIRDFYQDESVQIVFLSGKSQYAMQLFEVRPMNFLVKPVNLIKLEAVLGKGISLSQKLQMDFHYKKKNEYYRIAVKEILYFQNLEKEVIMVTLRGREQFYDSLKRIEKELEQYDFFMPHKSYLVNYRHVAVFSYEQLIMVNNERIPIAQLRRKAVRQMQILIESREM